MECPFCKLEDMPLLIKKYKFWRLVLADSQQLIGWCHIILNRHVEYYENLSSEEMKELQIVLKDHRNAMKTLFAPDHYNLMHMGDMIRHFHFHIVPRYKTSRSFHGKEFIDPDWGKMIKDQWKAENKDLLLDLKDHIIKTL